VRGGRDRLRRARAGHRPGLEHKRLRHDCAGRSRISAAAPWGAMTPRPRCSCAGGWKRLRIAQPHPCRKTVNRPGRSGPHAFLREAETPSSLRDWWGRFISERASLYTSNGWPSALEWLSRQLLQARLAFFPGNHDFYEGCIDREDMLRAAAEQTGPAYAQKAVLEIGRTRLLCCTLWTDFSLFGTASQPAAMYDARHFLNDYPSIRVAPLQALNPAEACPEPRRDPIQPVPAV